MASGKKETAKDKKRASAASSKHRTGAAKPSPFLLRALWVIVLILLFIPILKQAKSTDEEKQKAPPKENKLNAITWFAGTYQKRAEENLKENWVLKDDLIKFNNDIDFKLFHKTNVNGFVLGKDNYIFSKVYIDGYLGLDYIGEDSISRKLQMVRVLQDTLKKKGIDLVLVYAPDKTSFFPEYMPAKYNVKRGKTNFEDYIKHSQQLGLNFIDMSSWFLKMKPTSKYPLYPQYGHHWSFYGGCLAADSLIKYLAKLHNASFPYWGWKDVQMSPTPQYRDADILKKTNLSFVPPTYPMAYPVLQMGGGRSNTRVLGIADSYYRDFLFMNVMQEVFADGRYWYYYSKVFPESDRQLLEVWELDLKKEIESNQAIVILASGGSLYSFGWGFIEDAYQLYTDPAKFYKRKNAVFVLNTYKKQIHNDEQLLEEYKNEALLRNVDVDSVVTEKAREMMMANGDK